MSACARSWGSPTAGWDWCTLPKGHAGCCANSVRGPKPDAALFFEQQPEAQEEIDDARADEQKTRAKKAAGKPARPPAPGRSRYID